MRAVMRKVDVMYDVANSIGLFRNLDRMAEGIEALHPDWSDTITTGDIAEYLRRIS